MWHNFLSVLGYKLLIRSLTSYSPWANIAPGVFLLPEQARNPIPGCSVLIFLDLLFSCKRLARGIKVLSAFAYM